MRVEASRLHQLPLTKARIQGGSPYHSSSSSSSSSSCGYAPSVSSRPTPSNCYSETFSSSHPLSESMRRRMIIVLDRDEGETNTATLPKYIF
mmetsp:Transcript_33691/g.54691  ORF Transcript_33691/g.54691 Transcript_33691/m.54691 type:complete len:92 (+) Transcript_33691:1716-1991(+)